MKSGVAVFAECSTCSSVKANKVRVRSNEYSADCRFAELQLKSFRGTTRGEGSF